jgi:hypothetical protein
VQLLDSVSDHDDTYCIYTPVARGNLRKVVADCKIDPVAQVALLEDILRGLSWLNDQKGIWRLSINPRNLAVVSFSNPNGIVLDLYTPTQSPDPETQTDDRMNLHQYLAPEIIAFRLPPREELVGRVLPRNTVTPDRYKKLQETIDSIKGNYKKKITTCFLSSIEQMTGYLPQDRCSASALLDEVSTATAGLGRGSIVLKSLGRMRPREHDS